MPERAGIYVCLGKVAAVLTHGTSVWPASAAQGTAGALFNFSRKQKSDGSNGEPLRQLFVVAPRKVSARS